jgi:hypothetical protein
MPLYSNAPAVLHGLDEDHACATAAEFLAHLSPQHARWAWTSGDFSWVYRGERSDQFALRATVLRHRWSLVPFGAGADDDNVPGLDDALRTTLRVFAEGLNRAGLEIPQLPQLHGGAFLRDVARPGVFEGEEIPLMALARHHGVPTVLLDWSTRAYVAAYFAAWGAIEALRSKDAVPTDRLAVWALDASEHAFGDRGRLSIHRNVPTWTNPNMRAQQGLFTIVAATVDDPHGNSVDGFCAVPQAPPFVVPKLRRVTLPVEHAAELLWRLASEGITGASMFPGADGVVRSIRERTAWFTFAGYPAGV